MTDPEGRVLEEELPVNPLQFAAMVFLHRELTLHGEIILTQEDITVYERAIGDRHSGAVFDTNSRQDIILRPVKGKSDA